jgi:hypothetical protein
VLLIAVSAGCGGGSKALSRQEYASKADAICGKYNEQVKALSHPANLADLAKVTDKALPILDHAIGALHKLKPPKDEEKIVGQWLGQIDNLKADLTEIRDKAKANDELGVKAVLPKAQDHNKRSTELATELGMTVCNKP